MNSESLAVGPASLLPWSVVHALDGDPDGAHARELRGAILVADIVGYTRIAERLCGAGDDGLGRLSDLLNVQFGQYMKVVAEHGGEMISFAGDALIAGFLETTDQQHSAADSPSARARACAKTLAALSGAIPEIGEERVALHLGVATGAIWIARLGGWYGRWELLVGGEAVRGAFAAAGQAASGQVLAREFHVAIAAPPREPMPRFAGPDGVPDGHWGFGLVHPHLIDEIHRSRPVASELRHVAALFVRVSGLDERHPDALERHQTWIFAVHETLRAVASSAGRFLIDDKGLVFVLVLGDPGNARADDLDRILSVANSLEDRARSEQLHVGMGLATGRAFCGVIGNHLRRQYVTIGAPMNLAARLMDSGERGLLVALPFPTHRIPRFTLLPALTLDVKGFREPVAAARVEKKLGSDTATALHGRQTEVAVLSELVESTRHGQGGLAFILGDAGMGKSALLQWFRQTATENGVRCVLGEGDLTESASPYFAFRPIVRALLGGDDRESSAALQERLASWLVSMGRSVEFAPLFNSLMPLQLTETRTTEQLRGQTRAEVLVDLLVDLIRGAGDQPLAILIEDAHWIDSASAQLLDQIVTRLNRPLVLLTARPEAERDSIPSLFEQKGALRLELRPLELDAISSIGAAVCGAPLDPAALDLVQRQTQGNPFFVQEYVRELRDEGKLTFVESQWRLASTDIRVDRIPVTLHGVIGSRLDSLPTSARDALRAASVIGQQIDASLLAEVLGYSAAAAVSSVCALLSDRRLIVQDTAGADDGLKFAHALFQAVAYESLPVQNRQALHRAVGEAIERRKTPSLGHHVLLVHHFSRAQEMSRAVGYAELAAEEAIRSGGYREGRSFAELCVQQATVDSSLANPARRSRWQLTLADAANGLGDLPQRRLHATQVLILAGRRIPGSPSWSLLRAWGILARRAMQNRLLALGAPGRVSRADFPVESLARAYNHLALVSFFANDPLRGLLYAAHALVYAEKETHSNELPAALAKIGAWFGFAGVASVARSYFSQAFELAARLGDRPTAAQVSMIHSLYAVGRGEWQAVLADVDHCQRLCDEIGDRAQWGNSQIVRFWQYHYRGNGVAAEQAAVELEERARESGNLQQLSWALHARGLCALAAGAIEYARDLLASSVELIRNSPDQTALLSTEASLSHVLCLAGDRESGVALARDVLRVMEKTGRSMGHALTEGLSHIAGVMVEELRRSQTSSAAGEDARSAVGLLRRQARVFPIARPASFYWEAQLRATTGRSPRRSLENGFESARRLGMGYELRRLGVALEERGR